MSHPRIEKSIHSLNGRMDRLWPSEDGNGHKFWKGKPIIPVQAWEEISGLAEIDARVNEIMSRPEVVAAAGVGNYPQKVWDDLHNIRGEIKHEAISYFPDGLIHVAANAPIEYRLLKEGKSYLEDYDDDNNVIKVTYWTCPGHQEEWNAWAIEYREMLLKLKNLYEYDYMMDPEQAKF